MNKIKLTLPAGVVPVSGKQVTFTAPCDCTTVSCLQLDGVDYSVVDAAGNVVTGTGGAWVSGALVTVVLDVDAHKAYIQNAASGSNVICIDGGATMEIDASIGEGPYVIEITEDEEGGGTPNNGYTKEEVLTSTTSEMFGLDSSAVPNDVLAELGKYKQYYWKRETVPVYEYKPTLYVVESSTPLIHYASDPTIIKYSSSVTCTGSVVTLDNPQTKTIYTTTNYGDQDELAGQLLALAPCYFTTSVQGEHLVYYLHEGANYGQDYRSSTLTNSYDDDNEYEEEWYYVTASIGSSNPLHQVRSILTQVGGGDEEYLSSNDRNAYPDSGEVDGFTYSYLGVPLDNAVIPVRIATGTYIGDGTSGESNPTELILGFSPKLLWVCKNPGYIPWRPASTTSTSMCGEDGFLIQLSTETVTVVVMGWDSSGSGRSGNVYVTRNGNGVTWYTTSTVTQSSAIQANYGGRKYYYLAIG